MLYLNKHKKFLISAFKKIRDKEGEKTIFKIINALYENFKKNECKEKYLFKINKTQKIYCKDFLFQKILDENLIQIKKSIMLSKALKNKKMVIPIPISWFFFLRSKGVNISYLFVIFFFKNLTLNLLRGIKEFFKLINYETNQKINNSKYVTILSFPKKSLIQSNKGVTFIDYLRKKNDLKIINFQIIKEKNSADFNLDKYPFFPIPPSKKIEFILNSFFILFRVIINTLKGNWFFCYLFPEIIKLAYYNLTENKPKEIIFSQSNFIYRPLWTALSNNASLLFYSTNTGPFILRDGTSSQIYPGYLSMNYDRYYTFSNAHKNYLKSLKKKNIIKEKKCIPFVDENIIFKTPRGFNIALFVLQPFSESYLASIGRPINFSSYEISKKIVEDLLHWCKKKDANLLLKNKRVLADYKINKDWNNFLKNKKIYFVNPNLSPLKICRKSDCVISQPFTSSALFGREVKKPSIFYDATSFFKKKQDAADGIRILQGKNELFNWLDKVYTIKK